MSLPNTLYLAEKYTKDVHHEDDLRMAHKIFMKLPEVPYRRSKTLSYQLTGINSWAEVSIKNFRTREELFENPSQ